MINSPGRDFRDGCRLRAAAEFSAVFAHRRVLRGERFDLHYRPHTVPGTSDGAPARLGLVIAKKMAKRAVLRNLVKRIAREAFRQARPVLPSCDLVLRLAKPLPVADRASRRAWRQEIDALLARLARELSPDTHNAAAGGTQ